MSADDHKAFQHPATITAAALGASRPEGGGVVPIINPATTYEKGNAHMYYRNSGPGLADAEAVLNTLEGGAGALLFSSGMAAATHLLLALGPGAHILAPEGMYWFMRDWLKKTAPAMGLEVSFYANTDLDAIRTGIRPKPRRCGSKPRPIRTGRSPTSRRRLKSRTMPVPSCLSIPLVPRRS